MSWHRVLGIAFLTVVPAVASAQDWNSEATMALVQRAVERRTSVRTDSGLRDYWARAHGFVFFLGQLGELFGPPRLIKSDQLELEVYWKAPGVSKQRIVGWRDRADLPTDIRYHRDHLGIVTDNFGDMIGLGHDEEVHNVPHPLSTMGPRLYDYALIDSQTVRLPQQVVRVSRVQVRPKDVDAARVIGTLYIELDEAQLVRFQFNFTRNAYVDQSLEDITIVLENSLWEGQFWLPHRQEIEIRRRTSFLDLPARGIIRGRWEIDGYRFNLDPPDVAFRGPAIVAAPRAIRDTFPWTEPLDAAVREIAVPEATFDLESVRSEVKQLAEDRVLTGLATVKLGAGSISDIAHFNRVEGLALGGGWVLRPGGGTVEVHVWGSYGLSDKRGKGRLSVMRRVGRVSLEVGASREARDVGDFRVIAPALNSVLAQEAGKDYGDYYLATEAHGRVSVSAGTHYEVGLRIEARRVDSMPVAAAPARGTFRPNRDLGSGTFGVGTLTLGRKGGGFIADRGLSWELGLEGGTGEGVQYVRLQGSGRGHVALGRTEVAARALVMWGSRDLPAHRSVVLGGRGTLVSEPFRAWGGRYGGLVSLEWRIPVPFFAVPLGAFASTGNRIVVAPFAAAGWSGGALDRPVPWQPSGGWRPVVGLGTEWFHGLVRSEVAVSLRDGRVGFVVDLSRDLWNIL